MTKPVLKQVRLGFSCSLLAIAAAGTPAIAQVVTDQSDAEIAEAQISDVAENGEEIVVTGTRFGGRVVTDSPTPIDSISVGELTGTGAVELQNMIKTVVPSFNTPRPVAVGAADFLESPTLRGLSTGQLLVLVNGKRRHVSASLNFGNTIGRGDIGYDFNAIPALALSRIEVLRDGAAAQYGSDAIAGVINLVLDHSEGAVAQAQYGQTTEGDGRTVDAGVSAGFGFGKGGVIRITAQYQNQQETNRATPDTRQQYFGTNAAGRPTLPSGNFGSGVGLTPSNGTLDPREATIDRDLFVFGDPRYENVQLFANGKLPIAGDAAEIYVFGGYNKLEGLSFNFFRRSGQDETVREIYPDGFLPVQNVSLENLSAAGGVRGQIAGFRYDVSSVYAASTDDFGYSNSVNASQGPASQTSFYRGGFRYRTWTNNLDLAREVPIGLGEPLKIAAGAEYREERFRTVAGEPSSFANGGVAIIGGPNNGRPAPVGAQSAGGFSPLDALSAKRHSYAVYAELEKEFFDRLLVTAAVRHEDFSDFGTTTNYKLAGRFEFVEGFALRGSIGTGFRAPTLQQSFTANTNVIFVNGQPLNVRTVSVNDPIASLIGATPLRPEEAKNYSVGAVISFGGATLSADYYKVEIDDRIALSSNFSGSALTTFLAANGAPGISAVAYLTNAVDTTTQGFDLALTKRFALGDLGSLRATLATTVSETDFDRISGTPPALAAIGLTTALFDLMQQVRFTRSIPRDKGSLSLVWERGPFTASLVNTYYGSVAQVALTGRNAAQVEALRQGYDVTVQNANAAGTSFDLIQTFGSEIVADLELGYRITESITLAAGATNLFDNYPDRNIASTPATVATGSSGSDNNGTLPYSNIAPFGVNGASFYAKASIRF